MSDSDANIVWGAMTHLEEKDGPVEPVDPDALCELDFPSFHPRNNITRIPPPLSEAEVAARREAAEADEVSPSLPEPFYTLENGFDPSVMIYFPSQQ